jgi:CRISPR-associated protein Csm4
MNRLHRLRLRPRSAWRTPWQADTLAGMLCWMCARTEGEGVLRAEILDPMLGGAPPFVLSDAFPGDLLPVPAAVRLLPRAPDAHKSVKRARWISREAHARACAGGEVAVEELVAEPPIAEHGHTRNTLSRLTDTTGEEGSLFTHPEYRIDTSHAALAGADWLSVYVRVREGFEDHLLGLFHELACAGFGADASVGKGAFDFPEGEPELEPAEWLAPSPDDADAAVVLSTFQPAPADPVEGFWESFVKHGKLGPDFGVGDVRKNPLLLCRPGACFWTREARPFLGRAVAMDELLPAAAAAALRDRSVEVVHPAFGLAVPARLGAVSHDG